MSEPTIHRNKSNMSRMSALAKVANKYLSVPCTSVDSEHNFFAAAHVVDEKRNRKCFSLSKETCH